MMTTDDVDKEEKKLRDSITLDAKELYFLTGIIGSDRLLGIEDPFRGCLTDEIAEEWDRAKSALLKKGYLMEEPNGVELSMPPHVFSSVAVTGLAKRSCWVRYSHASEAFEGYLHMTDEMVIQRVRCNEDPNRYTLYEIGSVEEACRELIERMRWADQPETEMTSVILSKRHFHKLYEQAPQLTVEQMTCQLMTFDGEEEGALALARSMKNKVAEGEFLFLVWNEQDWDVQGLAFIIGDSCNWLIRKSSKGDEDWLTATPTTKEQFAQMFVQWDRQLAKDEGR
ncbi:Uncharacterised protein [Paenibacillus thiaminolyticus]|nr:Uncharacterised protein [Paenibacillus thiaminolyticus]